jgi:replicative superfamily II helicase
VSAPNSPIQSTLNRDLTLQRRHPPRATLPDERAQLVAELRELPDKICRILEKSILAGIAYHHAGMTGDEREIVEVKVQSHKTKYIVDVYTKY